MVIIGLTLLFWVLIGAAVTVPSWFTLRRRARKGLIPPNDERLECLQITMYVGFLTWPYALHVMAEHKTDYNYGLPPHLRSDQIQDEE